MDISVAILYLVALFLQIGATYVFVLCAKYLGIPKVNPFSVAFALIIIRRLIFITAIHLVPELKPTLSFIDASIMPVVFSLLLFIGTVQFYAKLTVYFRKDTHDTKGTDNTPLSNS